MPSPEFWNSLTGLGLDCINKLFNFRCSVEEIIGQDNLSLVRDKQEKAMANYGKSLPLMVVFNHVEAADPFWIGSVVGERLDGFFGNLIVPLAEHYTHFRNNPLATSLFYLSKKFPNVTFPALVQPYRLRDERLREDELGRLKTRSASLNRRFLAVLKDKLPQGGCLIMSPEGHRSKDYTLQPAEPGAGLVVLQLNRWKQSGVIPEEGIILPIGIKPYEVGDQTDRRRYSLIVGLPVGPERLISETERLMEQQGISGRVRSSLIAHVLMLKIGESLPSEMRGVYDVTNQEVFGQVLNDQLKIAIG